MLGYLMDALEASIGDDISFRLYAKDLSLALLSFEGAKEWADLINALQRLSKVFENSSFSQFNLLPPSSVLLLSKRLAQCLSPGLPDGVHLKTLAIYSQVFARLSSALLLKDLPLFSAGLFPLLQHCTERVQAAVLTIFETSYLGLGPLLLPACPGLLAALLPCLLESHEEVREHDTADRVLKLLNRLKDLCGSACFMSVVWRVCLLYPSLRLSALRFVSLTLATNSKAETEWLAGSLISHALQ